MGLVPLDTSKFGSKFDSIELSIYFDFGGQKIGLPKNFKLFSGLQEGGNVLAVLLDSVELDILVLGLHTE